jgi:hypothetical protein
MLTIGHAVALIEQKNTNENRAIDRGLAQPNACLHGLHRKAGREYRAARRSIEIAANQTLFPPTVGYFHGGINE